jgi:hypothetical protein
MSLEAPATRTPNMFSVSALARAIGRVWDFEVREKPLNLVVTIVLPVFAAYVYLCVKSVATGVQTYPFGDFHALWSSAVITHEGSAALNYDPDALHARQVAMGMNPHAYNPFPYPPIVLLLLAPLGAFGVGAAFGLFMIPSFALYLWSMVGGRARDWRWWLGACAAPASGITIISGQTGFLSGALMIGGLRLAANQPVLSGVLFGLLTFKPQLGVLVPFALVAAGLWRTIAAASATVAVGALLSSVVFGQGIWPRWVHSIVDYAGDFHPIAEYMPTIYANAIMLGASRGVALAAQLLVAIPVIAMVWRAFRAGPTPRACALLLVGTFLATPHAFNYDMPMMTAAIVWYLTERHEASRSLDVGELVSLILALILPFLMLVARGSGMAISYAPELLLFFLIARPQAAFADAKRPLTAGVADPVALG